MMAKAQNPCIMGWPYICEKRLQKLHSHSKVQVVIENLWSTWFGLAMSKDINRKSRLDNAWNYKWPGLYIINQSLSHQSSQRIWFVCGISFMSVWRPTGNRHVSLFDNIWGWRSPFQQNHVAISTWEWLRHSFGYSGRQEGLRTLFGRTWFQGLRF